jgi:hypothetical protein
VINTSRSWIERPPRILCVAAGVWFSAIVLVFSDTGVPFPIWALIGLLSMGLTAFWLIRLLITWFQNREHVGSIRRHWRWWLATSMLIVSGFVLASTLPLLSIRVYLSAKALRESSSVLTRVSQEDLFKNGRWIGLFHVTEFSAYGSELRFITSECGLVDTCGVVYSPDGPPQNRGEDSFAHLFGPWWHWYQSW